MKKDIIKRIKIFDTTLRDGEQSPGATMSFEEKIDVAKQLDKLGVDVIEAGFPVSNKEDFNAVKKIAGVVENAEVCALARCKKDDIDSAFSSIKNAKKPRIHVFIATSNIHLKNKLNMSKEQVIDSVGTNVAYAKSLCNNIEFSAEDATRTDKAFLKEVCDVAVDNGATTINLPDSVGFAQPKEHYEMIKSFAKNPKYSNITISVHCHDDLGLAVANSINGLEAGATQVECTINGIGERAGNAPLEEIAVLINTRKDVYPFETGINTKEIMNSSKMVSNYTGIQVQKNKAIVGQNAFSHEAGIHQHGVISNPQCYEIVNASSIGAKTNFVIGRHSGKHAIEMFLKNQNLSCNENTINEAFNVIKELRKGDNFESAIINHFGGVKNGKK